MYYNERIDNFGVSVEGEVIYQCDLCGQKVSGDMIVYVDHTQKHVIDLVKYDHPEWVETSGVCRKCLEYYQNEIKGSIFKDADCALRIRKTKNIFSWIAGLFKGNK